MQLPAINPSLAAPPLAPLKASGAANKSTDAETTAPRTDEPDATPGTQELSEADYRAITALKQIDREVRAHEMAHMAAAGGLVRGGASFSYTKGPDGQRYATGGEVSIDTSPERDDPEGTILKAQRIQAAALAPAQPSNTDRAVAAGAAQMAASARAELMTERSAENELKGEKSQPGAANGENNITGNTEETTSINEETNKPEPAADLYKLINRITSAEDTLGNLLNTAV